MAIYIITHKEYKNNLNYPEYHDLLVGAYKGHVFGEYYDDLGDNISDKNKAYCELTGEYWLWKNCCDDYIGIVHYRRYFSHDFFGKEYIRESEIKKILNSYDIILPFRQKFDCNMIKQYCEETGFEKDIRLVKNILEEEYPEYIADFDDYFYGNSSYFFNMMICSKVIFDNYCEWLFKILFQLENLVDLSGYNDYQKRIYGFLGERLLNVWVVHNNLKVLEMGVISTEKKNNLSARFLTAAKRSVRYRLIYLKNR